MANAKFSPMEDPEQVPGHMTDDESADFWDTNEITDDFLEKARPLEPSEMPNKRTEAKSITVRMDRDILERLQELAEKRHKGYQTLLKQFVIERLYEEEKRGTEQK